MRRRPQEFRRPPHQVGRVIAWLLPVLLPVLLPALSLAMAWAGWLLLRNGSLNRVRSSGVLRVGCAVAAPSAWVTAEGSVTVLTDEMLAHTPASVAR